MDDTPEFECPDCAAIFSIIFHNSLETQGGALYCPFCGESMDFRECCINPPQDPE